MLEKYGYCCKYPITSPSKNVSYMGLQHISQFQKEAYWIYHNWPIFPMGKAPGERNKTLTWLCQLLGHQPSHGRLTLILTLHQLQVTHLHQGVLAFWRNTCDWQKVNPWECVVVNTCEKTRYHAEGDQLDLLVFTLMLFNNIHFLIHTMTMGII